MARTRVFHSRRQGYAGRRLLDWRHPTRSIRRSDQYPQREKEKAAHKVSRRAGQKFSQRNQYGHTILRVYSVTLSEFAGFNLLIGDGSSLCYANNSQNIVSALESGIFDLSNDLLDRDWPKVNLGKKRLADLISQENSISTDTLIDLMSDCEIAADDILPDTGLPIELARILSATFIKHQQWNYGTRCSTALILTRRGGTVRFCEQSYNELGRAADAQYFEFRSESGLTVMKHRDPLYGVD